MRRFILLILLLIVASIAWGTGLTLLGFSGVMHQNFFVKEERFWFFIPQSPEATQITVTIQVSSENLGTDKACTVSIKWPENLQRSNNTNPSGMPLVGAIEDYDVYYALGLERQLRFVRNKFITEWQNLALKNTLDPNDPNRFCVGKKGGYWSQIQSEHRDVWANRLEVVGNAASEEFARRVRDEFASIIKTTGYAWLMWVLVIPMLLIVGAIIRLFFLVPENAP